MNKKILSFLEKTTSQLAFALLSGLAYFAIVYNLLITNTVSSGGLIVYFFLPAIVCGAALILIKLFRQSREEENEKRIIFLFWVHLILMIIALFMVLAGIIL